MIQNTSEWWPCEFVCLSRNGSPSATIKTSKECYRELSRDASWFKKRPKTWNMEINSAVFESWRWLITFRSSIESGRCMAWGWRCERMRKTSQCGHIPGNVCVWAHKCRKGISRWLHGRILGKVDEVSTASCCPIPLGFRVLKTQTRMKVQSCDLHNRTSLCNHRGN